MMKFCFRCMEKREHSDSICPECGFDLKNNLPDKTVLPCGSVAGNRYMIGECMYSDGFEHVYIGMDILSQKHVYLHEYFPSAFADRKTNVTFRITATDREAYQTGLAFFIKRAERLVACNDIEHFEHIVSHFDDHGTYYMVGEAVRGIRFGTILSLKFPKITYEEACTVISQVIDAIKELHLHEFYQCDLTPEHIVVGEKGVLVLAGGREKYEFRRQTGNDRVSPFSGYAAPELFLNEGIGKKTDVYAVAALFYHILSGIILMDILNDHYQEIRDIRKVNCMKAASKAVLSAVNSGLGIAGRERSSEYTGFQELQQFDKLPVRNLKKNFTDGAEEHKPIQRLSMPDIPKILIPLGILVLLFVGFQGYPAFSNRYDRKQPDRKAAEATFFPAKTATGEATSAGGVSETGETAPVLETTPAKKPTASPKKTPKRKKIKKKKTTPKPAPKPVSTPKPETYDGNSGESQSEEKTKPAPKPQEEVISGSDGEENITGIK